MVLRTQENKLYFMFFTQENKPGVGFMVEVAALRSSGLQFSLCLAVKHQVG